MAIQTVGNVKTSLNKWMREDVDDTIATEAISDGVASIWETLICIALSEFLGGPVQVTISPSSGLSMNMAQVAIAPADGVAGDTLGDADDVWYIQSMSVKTPGGTDRYWEGTEVGSELWRQMGRSIGGSTPYSPFVWDFDGNNFMIAPNPQQDLTPGYFYIKRPPVMVDDTTPIPFNHPSVEIFIRYNAISLMLLSLSEFQGSSAWGAKAEAIRMGIIKSSSMKNTRKNLRVQPIFR